VRKSTHDYILDMMILRKTAIKSKYSAIKKMQYNSQQKEQHDIVVVLLLVVPLLNRWSGSHARWGQPFRLRHLTTGRYLGLTEEGGLHLVERNRADVGTSSFCFQPSKVRGHTLNYTLCCLPFYCLA
jgi:hypothetical protein